MEYKRDLLQGNKRSNFRWIFGIAMVGMSIFWIISKGLGKDILGPFDWLYSALFGLSGIVHIMAGFGHPVERFFGKAFVHIDYQVISIKSGVFSKEQKADWPEIVSIEFKPNQFMIHKQDTSTQIISLSKLDFACISDIKAIVLTIADSNAIKNNL